jgi:hypothetical protein
MNERIKELAEQAEFSEKDLHIQGDNFQRFAELIIKDCASVVDGVYKAGGNTYSNLIYERFGIKYDWQK